MAFVNYFDYNTSFEDEQSLFIRNIYHDLRGGTGIRVSIHPYQDKDGSQKSMTTSYANRDIDRLVYRGKSKKTDVYLALSGHTTGRRGADTCYNRSVIFIDLDAHIEDGEEIAAAKLRTANVINQAIADGLLPVPTMITDSGRGFGIFYVLERSIAVTEKTEKMQFLFQKITSGLMDAFDRICTCGLQVDRRVCDSSRIARIPGTWNTKSGAKCKLLYAGKYTSITTLKPWTKYYEVRTVKNYAARFFSLETRIDHLKKIQELLKENDIQQGYREYCCFLMYNTAVQCMTELDSIDLVRKYNANFAHPLSEKELRGSISSVQRHRLRSGCCYRYTDKRIIEDLCSLPGMTEEMIRSCGFGMSKTQILGQAQTKKKTQEREEKWAKIKAHALENPDETYDQIAAFYNVNPDYLQRKLKKMGVNRNNTKPKTNTIAKEGPQVSNEHQNPGSKRVSQKPTSSKSVSINVTVDVHEVDPIWQAVEGYVDASFPDYILEQDPISVFYGTVLHAAGRSDRSYLFFAWNSFVSHKDWKNPRIMAMLCDALSQPEAPYGSYGTQPYYDIYKHYGTLYAKHQAMKSMTFEDRLKHYCKDGYQALFSILDQAHDQIYALYPNMSRSVLDDLWNEMCKYLLLILKDSKRRDGYEIDGTFVSGANLHYTLYHITIAQLLAIFHEYTNCSKLYHPFGFTVKQIYYHTQLAG